MSCCEAANSEYHYEADQLDPSINLNWLDDNGRPRDLSAYTGRVDFKYDGALIHSAAGVTTADELPNFSLALVQADLDALSPALGAEEKTYDAWFYITLASRSNAAGPIPVTFGPKSA